MSDDRSERLRASDPSQRLAAFEELAAAAPEALTHDEVDALIASLGDERKVIQRRAAEVCARLAARGASLRAAVVTALASATPRQRWGAAYALSLIDEDPVEAAPVLLEALGSDDGDVRWAAAAVLVRLGSRHVEIADRLLDRAGGGSVEERKMAFYCLRDLDTQVEETVRRAVRATSDPDAGVVLAALATLARMARGDAGAVQAALRLLARAEAPLRRAAASALGHLGGESPEARAALEAATRSADPSLRRAAERALQQLERARR